MNKLKKTISTMLWCAAMILILLVFTAIICFGCYYEYKKMTFFLGM